MTKRTRFVGIIILCLCLCLMYASSQAEETLITATIFPLYIAAANIAQGVPGVRVQCMAQPQAGCLHDYQITTADMKMLAESDIVIRNGAGLEAFWESILPRLPVQSIDASEGVPTLPGHHGEAVNPHLWVSVAGMRAQVRNITDGLCAFDPAHAAQYAQNGEAYIARLELLEAEMRAALAQVEGAPIVTFHEAFDYFANDFSLRLVAVIEEAPGSAPSARALAGVAEKVGEEGVRALFAEPQYENQSVLILSRETGVPIYTLDPVASGDAEAAPLTAYEDAMRENVRVLLEALS